MRGFSSKCSSEYSRLVAELFGASGRCVECNAITGDDLALHVREDVVAGLGRFAGRIVLHGCHVLSQRGEMRSHSLAD